MGGLLSPSSVFHDRKRLHFCGKHIMERCFPQHKKSGAPCLICSLHKRQLIKNCSVKGVFLCTKGNCQQSKKPRLSDCIPKREKVNLLSQSDMALTKQQYKNTHARFFIIPFAALVYAGGKESGLLVTIVGERRASPSCLPETEEPSVRLPSSGLCGLMIQAWLEFFCAISISVCFRFRQRHGMLLLTWRSVKLRYFRAMIYKA